MCRRFLTVLFFLFYLSASAQDNIKRELRGAWIATYSNIDWPDRSHTPEQQRQDFIRIIDYLKKTGINAVYVQVRSQADAMYASELEPWSADLTGVQGMPPSPFWDPLHFMIAECRKRAIEFHAWINPYRVAGKSTNIQSFSASHIAKRQPGWLLRSGGKVTLNPALPQVRQYIVAILTDIVKRYDVDGIHFDDYFYPEPGFNDDAAYLIYNRGILSRADWRRDNVNLLVEEVSREIKKIKPWVKFGISPSGIYRNSTDPTSGSATNGMEHYNILYADSRKWLQEGWVDYIEPQVYWYAGQPAADYNALIPWWNNNAFGRHIYIGMAGYKVESWGNSPWANPLQIPNQLRLNRSFIRQNIKGSAFYNTSSMKLNLLGFNDSLKNNFYRFPALVPVMPWRDSIPPLPPSGLSATIYQEDSVMLLWNKSPASNSEMNLAKQYVVYRSLTPDVDIEQSENIISVLPDTNIYNDIRIIPGAIYYYAVTALDRLSNESSPSNIALAGKEGMLITFRNIQVRTLNDKEVESSLSLARDSSLKEYMLERSTDGQTFTPLRTLPRDTSEKPAYKMTDKIARYNAPVFYRVKSVDSSGQFSYSRVVSHVVAKDIEIARLNTKVPKGMDLRIGVQVTGIIEYALLDDIRKKVTWGKIKPLAVNTQVILPGTKDLLPGNYVVNLKYNNMQQNIHLLIP
ncbi:MAG: family 10 glycosylhydrolase [Ferruginibacter sp.]